MRFPNIRQNTRIGPLMVFLLMSSGRRNIGSFKRALNTNSVGYTKDYFKNIFKNILQYKFDALDI